MRLVASQAGRGPAAALGRGEVLNPGVARGRVEDGRGPRVALGRGEARDREVARRCVVAEDPVAVWVRREARGPGEGWAPRVAAHSGAARVAEMFREGRRGGGGLEVAGVGGQGRGSGRFVVAWMVVGEDRRGVSPTSALHQ